MYARFDLSAFPVVTIAFTGESSTDENFQQYLNETEALYEHKKRFSIIFDARSASLPDLKHQKMQANWIKANESRMKTYCAGTAYVIALPRQTSPPPKHPCRLSLVAERGIL
ncbi:MAG: hypothetical protein ABR574_12295 [Cryomorphaceae bacterium]